MRAWAIPLLRCPRTGARLALAEREPQDADEEIEHGTLVTEDGKQHYNIVRGVPRFVPQENYAANFGLQWNRFRQSQLDSHSGVPISLQRFFRYSGWQPENLKGKLVLDIGCGAGRFTEVALDCGARVIALDYSSAVDACRSNHGDRPTLSVVQGDIYHLPLAPGAFDYVYCFGVLQHTPDVAGAFRELPRMLAPGGQLAVDVYPRLWRNLLWSKYWLRPLTKRTDPVKLFKLVERWVPRLLPISAAISRIPVIGPKMRYLIPVANHAVDYPLSPGQVKEWAVLDTFDMLAPAHDHPQSLDTLRQWFDDAGLHDVHVSRMGFNVGRGKRPVDA